MNDVKDIAKLAEEASDLFQKHGSADSAALLLEKAGNMLLDSSTVDALRLFQHASDVALVGSKKCSFVYFLVFDFFQHAFGGVLVNYENHLFLYFIIFDNTDLILAITDTR